MINQLCIISGIWEENGLNMRSTDTRTCIHQHYFSRAGVALGVGKGAEAPECFQKSPECFYDHALYASSSLSFHAH